MVSPVPCISLSVALSTTTPQTEDISFAILIELKEGKEPTAKGEVCAYHLAISQ